MIEDYRIRKQKFSLDGSPIFTTEEDVANELKVAKELEIKWDCKLHHLGIYSPVDWWAERHGQPVGWVEIKSRQYKDNEKQFPTELLNLRKWLSLMLLNSTTDIPAIFVSNANDIIRWIPVANISVNGENIKVIQPKGGIVKSRNDREPCILIKHSEMQIIK